MLEKTLRLLATKEISLIKRRFSGLVLIFGSLMLALLALASLSFTLFLWLAERIPPWQAALSVSGVIFLASLLMWLAGKLIMRRRHSISTELEEEIRTIATILLPETGSDREKKIWSVVAVAALIGMIVGRSSGK
jgi:cyanate permease